MATPNVTLFAQAGLLDPADLTPEDREVIEQLTESEVQALISIASRIYPQERGIVKLSDLGRKSFRICVPL